MLGGVISSLTAGLLLFHHPTALALSSRCRSPLTPTLASRRSLMCARPEEALHTVELLDLPDLPDVVYRTAAWLNRQQQRARAIRCPFWRRRAAEALEPLAVVMRFVAARHKSLDLPLVAPARASVAPKARDLSLSEMTEIISGDLSHRQYYITGRLTPSIYADDCFFDGPDPDMPVRSLQRYSDALHGLFDPSSSTLELLDIRPHGERAIIARWRLSGALKLPWRPSFKPFTGCTLYEMDPASGLVYRHTETWSISAIDAFVSVFFPDFGAPAAPPAESIREAVQAAEGHLHPLHSFLVPPPRMDPKRKCAGLSVE